MKASSHRPIPIFLLAYIGIVDIYNVIHFLNTDNWVWDNKTIVNTQTRYTNELNVDSTVPLYLTL